MKKNIILIASLLLLSATTLWAKDRPNFIFIFADDLGWGDLGCYGHPLLKTPSLDKMAREGLMLTNFYVANPVCSPSRTAVMTGQYPSRHGIHRHFASHKLNAERNMPDFLDPNTTLITKLMQENGYKTGHFGKWHLGSGKDAPSPSEYGIDTHVTTNSNDYKLKVPRNKSTEVMVDEAIAFIEENKDESFYLNVWTLVPHANLDPTDEQMAPYESLGPMGVAKERGFSTPRQIYYGAVTDMDFHLGRLMEKLDELGLSENTIIVLSSDNGPEDINVVNAAHSGVGSAGPFRGRKRSLYEGGVRVPFILKWKGHTAEGVVDDKSIVSTVDLLPTFCSLAGIELPEGYQPDGQDFSPLLAGETMERNTPLFWDWTATQMGNTYHKSPGLALRYGKWKFLMNPDGSRKELYDFEADPQCMEVDNLADKYSEQVKQFSEMLLEFKASIPQGVPTEVSGTNYYPMPKSTTELQNEEYTNKIQRYGHGFSEPHDFTPEEYEYIANNYSIFTVEKRHAWADYGPKPNTEAATIGTAKKLKSINPDIKVLIYWNIVLNWNFYESQLEFNKHPEWRGKDWEFKHVDIDPRPTYDLNNPEVQEWWVNAIADPIIRGDLDGVFLDAAPKVPADQYESLLKVIDEVRAKIGEDKIVIYNGFRVKDTELQGGQDIIAHTSGVFIEFFLHSPLDTKEEAALLFDNLIEAEKAGKMIIPRGNPKSVLPGTKEPFLFSLASFLLFYGPDSYYLYNSGYEKTRGMLEGFPEFDMATGKALGSAKRNGWVYTREFENIKVTVDLESSEAKIEQRASASQE